MVISFNPKFGIGDVVSLKLEPSVKYVIDGYQIKQVDELGNVTYFQYGLYDAGGITFCYTDIDLELVEKVNR
jgi:hypothetical protein